MELVNLRIFTGGTVCFCSDEVRLEHRNSTSLREVQKSVSIFIKKGCPKAPYPLEKVPGWQIAHDEEFTASAHKTKRRPAVKVLGSVPTVQYRRPVQPSLTVRPRRFQKHTKLEQYYPMLSRNIQGGMKCKTMPSSILEPHALKTGTRQYATPPKRPP